MSDKPQTAARARDVCVSMASPSSWGRLNSGEQQEFSSSVSNGILNGCTSGGIHRIVISWARKGKKTPALEQKGEWRKQKWVAADISKRRERKRKVKSEFSSSHRRLSGYLEAEGPQQSFGNVTSQRAHSQADQRLCTLALERRKMREIWREWLWLNQRQTMKRKQLVFTWEPWLYKIWFK